MTTYPPLILAIGSCRILRPLRRLHAQGAVRLFNYDDHMWFTHTAASARNYIDIIQGRVEVPNELREATLDSHIDFGPNLCADSVKADAVVVEVSTLKEHVVGDVHVNAHKVYGIAKKLGIPHHPIIQGDTRALPDYHPLKSMRVHYASKEEVAIDLLYIIQRLQAPMMTVNNLYSLTAEGTQVPERVRLSSTLEDIEAAHGIPFFDTSSIILQHGLEVALEDQNHYRRNFEPVVAEALYRGVLHLMHRNA
ncbi:hypothetical protein [Kocuria sp. U4B]